MKCPNCGNDNINESNFCSSCGSSLQKKTKIPLIAGILAIISSCLAFNAGDLLLLIAWIVFNENAETLRLGGTRAQLFPFPAYVVYVGIFGIAAFVFGLSAGVLLINKKFLRMSMLGLTLLTIFGIVVTMPILGNWEMGSPMILLSAVSIYLTAKSKTEFH